MTKSQLPKRILKMFIGALLILILLLSAFFALGAILKNDLGLSPWGTGMYQITTGSMGKKLPVGSLIFITAVAPDKIKTRDMVTFYSDTEDKIITHRVRNVISDENGYIYTTRGDANPADDPPLPYDKVIGRVLFYIPSGLLHTVMLDILPYFAIALILAGIIIIICVAIKEKKKKKALMEAEAKTMEANQPEDEASDDIFTGTPNGLGAFPQYEKEEGELINQSKKTEVLSDDGSDSER